VVESVDRINQRRRHSTDISQLKWLIHHHHSHFAFRRPMARGNFFESLVSAARSIQRQDQTDREIGLVDLPARHSH